MKTTVRFTGFMVAMALAVGGSVLAFAEPLLTPSTSNSWQYTLLPGSSITDECPICGRPGFEVPMRGTFMLRLIHQDANSSTYAWENIQWQDNSSAVAQYRITGRGEYEMNNNSGQKLFLQLSIDDGTTNRLCYFTNLTTTVLRSWPALEISLDQTNGTWIQVYHLRLAAAPLRELWFSTQNSFHAGIWQAPSNFVSAGDLISFSGRVIKRHQDLTRFFEFGPDGVDLGLDALDLLPGGEIAFSIKQDCFSESLQTTLHNSDVLSSRGRIITNYLALFAAFGPGFSSYHPGLDALQFMANGEIYFSITNEFFYGELGQIRRGDLLSSRGVIIKRNGQSGQSRMGLWIGRHLRLARWGDLVFGRGRV